MSDVQVSRLAIAADASQGVLQGMVTSEVASILGSESRPDGYKRWMLRYATTRAPNEGPRFDYCPMCLTEGSIPFWRDRWRFAMTTSCGRHRSLLLDTCAACGAQQNLSMRRRVSLLQCSRCKSPLQQAAQVLPALTQLPSWPDPLSIGQADMPVAVAHPRLFWDGLWFLVTQLTTKSHANNVLTETAEPTWALPTLESIARLGGRHVYFEGLSSIDRHILLALSRWLLADWPRRLVDYMKSTRLSWAALNGREVSPPFWLISAIEPFFRRGRYVLSDAEVQAAKASLPRATDQPSKKKLRTALGVTSALAIDRAVQLYTRPFTEVDLFKLVTTLQRRMDLVSTKRAQRAAMVRDCLAITVAALTGRSFVDLAQWPNSDIRRAFGDDQGPAGVPAWQAELRQRTNHWRDEYEAEIRPAFALVNADMKARPPRAYFLTRFGLPAGGNSLPQLLASGLEEIEYPDRWRGVKVLADLWRRNTRHR